MKPVVNREWMFVEVVVARPVESEVVARVWEPVAVELLVEMADFVIAGLVDCHRFDKILIPRNFEFHTGYKT
jgi:hypothetical protein